MKPKGFVAAASITSQTSTPRCSQMSAISLATATLIARKVFSSSFAISATTGDETDITSSTIVS
jgi:hypothetical protein